MKKISTATTARTQKPTGIPNGFSAPIQSQRSSLRALIEICTN